jgi:hypothetical protein
MLFSLLKTVVLIVEDYVVLIVEDPVVLIVEDPVALIVEDSVVLIDNRVFNNENNSLQQ